MPGLIDSNSPRLFTTIQAVFRAYDTTKLYRDLKLRGRGVIVNEHSIDPPPTLNPILLLLLLLRGGYWEPALDRN